MSEVTDADRYAISAAIGQRVNALNQARSSDAFAREQAEAAQRIQAERAAARRKLALDNLAAFTAVVKSEEIERALAERERLATALAEARASADASALTLAHAEAAWERAAAHTLTDAQVLTTLRAETPRLVAAVAPLEVDLAAVEDRIADLRGVAEDQQRRALAREVWPPVARRLATWARNGLALLAEQRATRERLYDAGAWAFAQAQIDELAITDRYGSDQITDALTAWLAQAERAGLATDATVEEPDAAQAARKGRGR